MKTLRALAQYPLFYAALLSLGLMCLGWCFVAWAMRPILPSDKGRELGRSRQSVSWGVDLRPSDADG